MTADETDVPAAPSPLTERQILAFHGRNAVEVHDDEQPIDIIAHARVAEALLNPDSPILPQEEPTTGGAS